MDTQLKAKLQLAVEFWIIENDIIGGFIPEGSRSEERALAFILTTMAEIGFDELMQSPKAAHVIRECSKDPEFFKTALDKFIEEE